MRVWRQPNYNAKSSHILYRIECRNTHQYEALSYTWGGEQKPCSIFIGHEKFDVTENLHAALLRLRRRYLERIVWVDAICIDQKSEEERGQQVQIMAMIYSKAYCVIVWLGEITDDVKGALECIQCAANEESNRQSTKDVTVVKNLLQRRWFQRIWIKVLQEVAAARHVILVCGSTEIDGYAFCLGLKAMQNSEGLSNIAIPALHSLPSLMNLIERAGLRPKDTANSLQQYSLGIGSLAELIDMFRTRQASDLRDKVYALLGMSSDYPSEANLRPDYKIAWGELLQRLVMYILGPDVSVKAIDQNTVIKSKGYILGQVSSVSRGRGQNVNVTFVNGNHELERKTSWLLQASAEPIREHDVVCILNRASKPTIIRLCKDGFAIVVIAVTPMNNSSVSKWPGRSQSKTHFSRGFLLVWDWENSHEELKDHEDYNILIKAYGQAQVYSKGESRDHLHEANQMWNDIMILDDLGEYSKADVRIQEARDSYITTFKKDCLPKQLHQYGRTLLSFAAGEGHDDIVRLLLFTTHPDLKDSQSGQTPLQIATQNGHEAVVKLLLETGKVDADLKNKYGSTPLHLAAKNGHEAVVKLLLKTSKVNPDLKDMYRSTPLHLAAENRHEAVVKLLLETSKVDEDSKDESRHTPLRLAAENGHEAVVKLLLETGKFDADSKGEYGLRPLHLAARNEHEAVVKLLLETGKVDAYSKDYGGRTLLHLAAGKGYEAIVKLLLETGNVEADLTDEYGWTPLHLAAEDGHEAVVKLLLETGKVDADSKGDHDWTPLHLVALKGHEAVVKLLLNTGKVDADTKDMYRSTPLHLAAENRHEAVVKLLLETSKVDEDSKDESRHTPLRLAAENGHEAVVKLLLETGKVDANSIGNSGQTALQLAAMNGHEAVVELLLETGKVDADSKDSYGTPLQLAAENGHEAVVKLNWIKQSKQWGERMMIIWRSKVTCPGSNKLLLETDKVDAASKDRAHLMRLRSASVGEYTAMVNLLRSDSVGEYTDMVNLLRSEY